MKTLVYTVNLGGYDEVAPITIKEDFDYILFTDGEDVQGWKTVKVEVTDPLKQSREIKINIHKFVQGYDRYIYMDGNFQVVRSLTGLTKYFKGGYLTIAHRQRRCVYQEAKRVIAIGKDSKDVVDQQMAKYFKERFPVNIGLYQNGFFIRDNSFNEVCETWYSEVEKHSWRDQLSLPYALWKHKKNVVILPYKIVYNHIVLSRRLNSHSLNGSPRIWYFVPGAGDKNLGRILNAHMELVPNDDDWVLIRDNDTCFLHPFINKQLEDIILKHGDKFDIFSCVTNRLGLKWQLPYGLDDDPDILNHYKRAEFHFDNHYDEVVQSRKETAGLFILMKKSTWRKHPFDEGLASYGGNFIDFRFSKNQRLKGSRIGICKGIYMFHYYRLHKAVRDISHLV